MDTQELQNSIEKFVDSKHKDAEYDSLVPMGETIGCWKVIALLGKGGSAEVYRVKHIHHNISAALKIITSTDERARERFTRERELLQIQTLTCFARFIDSGEWSGHPYLVTEELESFELPHQDPAVTKFVLAVCSAVASLHEEGYVHRDLKPGNIMRRKDGSYVLIDLGLVKKIGDDKDTGLNNDQLSIVGGKPVGVGTVGFSAPEQFISGTASIDSDIHAIGAIINECFDGKPTDEWAELVARATSSIRTIRFKTMHELIYAVKNASDIRPRVTTWAIRLSWVYAWLWVGLAFFWLIIAICGFSNRANAFGSFATGLLFASFFLWVSRSLSKRKRWARGYVIFAACFWALGMCIAPIEQITKHEFSWMSLVVCPIVALVRIVPGVLMFSADSKRWFRVAKN